MSGIHGNAGQTNYGLAKAGVVGLTKVIAKEWGPQFGVRSRREPLLQLLMGRRLPWAYHKLRRM